MALPIKFRFRRKDSSNKMNGWLALSPIFVFIGVYLVGAFLSHSFYTIPITVPFILATVYSFVITHRYESTSKTVNIYSEGAGDQNVLLMIWIVILAGAFAGTSKDIGAIDSIANIVKAYLPGRLFYFGMFIASCVISMAIGSNIGTVVALVPIATGLAEGTNMSLPLLTAIVIGGGAFGDNLSFISDTTIAATSTLGCNMRDKFRANILIAGPAAIIVAIIYIVLGYSVDFVAQIGKIEWLTIIPYAATIIFAIMGVNVVTVLTIGTILNGILGIALGKYDMLGWMNAIGDGIAGINEMIIVFLLAGGMLELVRYNGGIDFIVNKSLKHINSKRGAELGLAALVSFATCCTANNTIAILTTGKIAKNVVDQYKLNPIKTASILDTFSCLFQCTIPYGAHLLMASALAHAGTFAIIKCLYYPLVLGVVATLAILFRYPRKYR